MRRYPITLIVLFICLCFTKTNAQTVKERVFEAFSKIQQAYKGDSALTFSIQYLYSNIKSPGEIRDSVSGKFKIKGPNSWGVLGEAEYINNHDYTITLFRRTASMLLDKRDDEETLSFFRLDSFFARSNEFSLVMPKPGDVVVNFTANAIWDSAHLRYDPETFRLQKMDYYLKASASASEENSEAGLVQIIFSNYSTLPFDESVFATERYVEKKGKAFYPSAAYAAYTLNLASSKLLN